MYSRRRRPFERGANGGIRYLVLIQMENRVQIVLNAKIHFDNVVEPEGHLKWNLASSLRWHVFFYIWPM